MEMISIDEGRCTLCALCIPVCVRRILEEREGTVKVTDSTLCIQCGHCKAICPEDAPQLPFLNTEEFVPVHLQEDIPKPGQLMGFFRARRTIRIFKWKIPKKETLKKIIQAGRFAPTGANRQGLQYVVLHRAESIQTIRGMAIEALLKLAQKIENATAKAQKTGETLPLKYQLMQFYPTVWRNLADLNKQGIDKLFYHAPALIIGHFNPSESVTPNMDPGLSAMQMLLMAEALELGTCLSGFTVFALEESSELRKTVQIPEGHQVPFAFMLGYPDVTFDRLVSRNPARVKWL